MATSAYDPTTNLFRDGVTLNKDDLNAFAANEVGRALPAIGTNFLYGGSGNAGTAQAVTIGLPLTYTSGVLSVRLATNGQTGVVRPDGVSIFADANGIISAAAIAPLAYQETAYTASGAVNPADDTAVFNSASPITMTLASGTAAGHIMILKQFNAGTVTLTLVLDGGSRTLTLNPASPPLNDTLNIRWSQARNSWLGF